jgi:hypothetical protein
LYAEYSLASVGATPASGVSQRLGGAVSHEQGTRDLAGSKKTAADLWRTGKPLVRQVQAQAGVVILDDARAEKPDPDENELGGPYATAVNTFG